VVKSSFGIIVHGGAGSLSLSMKEDIHLRRETLRKSATEGYNILRNGGSSLDAVEASIWVLEDSQIFNAGAGSCTTIDGKVEPDAAVMLGDLRCGAVAGANMVSNPISLARAVMEKTDHVFIAGSEPLRMFAKSIKIELHNLKPTGSRLKQYREYLRKMKADELKEWPKNSKLVGSYDQSYGNLDTVGSVAIDSFGRLCAGVSTGGRFMKLPGRVGDSAIPGAGIYADSNSGAASATGAGEEIIRVSLCKTVCDFMKHGLDAQSACDASISLLSNVRGVGTAGVIAIDAEGNYGLARNTEMMPASLCFSYRDKPVTAVGPNEYSDLYLRKSSVNQTGKLKM
jgi:L-asparaginase / beta-aspartyl-peptidase